MALLTALFAHGAAHGARALARAHRERGNTLARRTIATRGRSRARRAPSQAGGRRPARVAVVGGVLRQASAGAVGVPGRRRPPAVPQPRGVAPLDLRRSDRPRPGRDATRPRPGRARSRPGGCSSRATSLAWSRPAAAEIPVTWSCGWRTTGADGDGDPTVDTTACLWSVRRPSDPGGRGRRTLRCSADGGRRRNRTGQDPDDPAGRLNMLNCGYTRRNVHEALHGSGGGRTADCAVPVVRPDARRIAKKEAERRKATPAAAKTYTNEDLKRLPALAGKPEAGGRSTKPASRRPTKPDDPAKAWRAREGDAPSRRNPRRTRSTGAAGSPPRREEIRRNEVVP